MKVKYRTDEWEPLPKLHCPRCGVRAVWHDCGWGDYYVEKQYACCGCGAKWYLAGGVNVDSAESELVAKIRAAICEHCALQVTQPQ